MIRRTTARLYGSSGLSTPLSHRPPRIDVKYFGEFFRVVARHYDVRALDFVENVLPLQKRSPQVSSRATSGTH